MPQSCYIHVFSYFHEAWPFLFYTSLCVYWMPGSSSGPVLVDLEQMLYSWLCVGNWHITYCTFPVCVGRKWSSQGCFKPVSANCRSNVAGPFQLFFFFLRFMQQFCGRCLFIIFNLLNVCRWLLLQMVTSEVCTLGDFQAKGVYKSVWSLAEFPVSATLKAEPFRTLIL